MQVPEFHKGPQFHTCPPFLSASQEASQKALDAEPSSLASAQGRPCH